MEFLGSLGGSEDVVIAERGVNFRKVALYKHSQSLQFTDLNSPLFPA